VLFYCFFYCHRLLFCCYSLYRLIADLVQNIRKDHVELSNFVVNLLDSANARKPFLNFSLYVWLYFLSKAKLPLLPEVMFKKYSGVPSMHSIEIVVHGTRSTTVVLVQVHVRMFGDDRHVFGIPWTITFRHFICSRILGSPISAVRIR
jgi:hypothetical protein